jgi:hypothetical protein
VSEGLQQDLRLALYHVERLGRPMIMHSERIEWTDGVDLQDEIAEHDTEGRSTFRKSPLRQT